MYVYYTLYMYYASVLPTSIIMTSFCVIMTSIHFARSLYGRYHLRDFNELDHELALRYSLIIVYTVWKFIHTVYTVHTVHTYCTYILYITLRNSLSAN